MAEASILMLLNRLAPIIEKRVRQEVCLFLNASSEAEKLSTKLKKIQDVLMDAEHKRVTDPKIQSWLEKLQCIYYDAEDVLDEWDVTNLRRQLDELEDDESADTWLNKVSAFLQSVCLCFKQSLDHRSVALNMKKLNERLDSVAEENDKEFKFVPNLTREIPQDVKRIISTSFVDVSEVQGRDEDREILMEMLLPRPQNASSSGGGDAVKIVSIVGAGGMGKTTLAQFLFNNDVLKFDFKIWVCVSDPFDVSKIGKAIIEAITKSSPRVSELQSLLECVGESISGKKILLILDDVWTEDDTMWNPLKVCLIKNCGLGSRTLVTTRNKKVAEAMGSIQDQIHFLCPLSDSYGWSILSKIAFHGREESEKEILENVGKKIALKCKGLPLAAKTLGSLLRFKNSLQEWENVSNSEILELEKVTEDMFPILALSYNELRPQVKRCFSYCAFFPKDFEFDVDELVRIWMAQGFLCSSSSSSESIEQKGMGYFEDLAMHSFFQDFQMYEYPRSGIFQCKMHDIIHDFAQFLTKNECLIIDGVGGEGSIGKNVRHQTLQEFEGKKIIMQDLRSHYQIENFHSFFFTGNEIALEIFNYLKRVRTLILRKCELEVIPEEIGNLIHLRYLDLSRNLFEELPKSVNDLCNLQTLNIQFIRDLIELPQGIHKLRNLRHLLNEGSPALFPHGFEKLTNLQTLDELRCKGEREMNKVGYLKDMNQLGGFFRILIDKETSLLEAEKADLKSKRLIQHLELEFTSNVELEIIEALQPSSSLPCLDFSGPQLPNWIASIADLRKLQISSVPVDDVDLSSLMSLRFLEDLRLWGMGMKRLKGFGVNPSREATFPKLKRLVFRSCSEWEEWEDELGEEEDDSIILPCLQHLELDYCEKLRALPRRLMRKLSARDNLKIAASTYLKESYGQGSRTYKKATDKEEEIEIWSDSDKDSVC